MNHLVADDKLHTQCGEIIPTALLPEVKALFDVTNGTKFTYKSKTSNDCLECFGTQGE